MQRIGMFENFKVDGIVGMDVPERYRNKMVFPVGNVYGKNVCGFYAMRSHDIIPLDDCSLGDEFNREINDAVIDYMNENNVSAYDEKSHKGIVRRVFTRKSFSANEIMVVVSVNAKSLPKRDKLISKLRKVSDRIVSIVLNINTKRNNLVLTEENVILWGKDRISDTLCGVKFDISPQSFFQVNPVQTEKLYSKALEYADIDENTSVMDIYCGIGTISLCAAKNAKSVVGVEIVERAIEDAKENAAFERCTDVITNMIIKYGPLLKRKWAVEEWLRNIHVGCLWKELAVKRYGRYVENMKKWKFGLGKSAA